MLGIYGKHSLMMMLVACICVGSGCTTPPRLGGPPIVVGWVQFAGELRIYAQKSDLGKLHDGSCISGVMANGVRFPWNLNGKRVAAYGTFIGRGELEAMALRGESIGAENYCASENLGLFTRIVAAEASP